jgi:hypothetical protein
MKVWCGKAWLFCVQWSSGFKLAHCLSEILPKQWPYNSTWTKLRRAWIYRARAREPHLEMKAPIMSTFSLQGRGAYLMHQALRNWLNLDKGRGHHSFDGQSEWNQIKIGSEMKDFRNQAAKSAHSKAHHIQRENTLGWPGNRPIHHSEKWI